METVFNILDNWKSDFYNREFLNAWLNQTRGFFIRNTKVHKAQPKVKLNHFQKLEKFKLKEKTK